MNIAMRWFAAGLLALLAGCAAAQGPGFDGWKNPKEGLGVVYLYRPWSAVGGLLPTRVQVDGKNGPDLRNGGYQVHELPPGTHTIVVAMGSVPITTDTTRVDVKVEAGSVLYLKFVARKKDVGGGNVVRLNELALVNKTVARREIPATKLSM